MYPVTSLGRCPCIAEHSFLVSRYRLLTHDVVTPKATEFKNKLPITLGLPEGKVLRDYSRQKKNISR